MRGIGIMLNGNRTAQRKQSALDRLNVRMMVLELKDVIAASTIFVNFELNDEFTWSDWIGRVEPVVAQVKEGRGVYDYRVIMSPTDQEINEHKMPGQVLIQPTKTAEFISIDFVLLPSGAEFPGQ